MTRGGAASLIKFYRDKLGCKVVKDPYLNEDGVQWSLEITEPVWKVI